MPINSYNNASKDNPVITVIVAVLNSAKTFQLCLESIIAQNYPNKELIVMDGGSTDGSVELLKRYDNYITYWESQPDNGIYHAWNKALEHARGDWFCFLGADDRLNNKEILTRLVPYLQKSCEQQIRVVYGRVVKSDNNGNVVRLEGKPWTEVGWLMKHGMSIPHPGLMHHRSLFEQHGNFDESFRIAGDYDLLLRELKDHPAMFAEDVKTVVCQIGGVADSNNLIAAREVFKARRKCGLPIFSWVWSLVYLRAIFRNLASRFTFKVKI